jgi:DNA ligase (NAD+)
MDENIISEPFEIFEIKEGDLIPLERFAERKTKNLIEAIEKSKKIDLDRFIYALGIRHVGEETAIDLANFFGSINKLKKAAREELEKIPNVGGKVSESIYNWFQSERNQKFIEELFRVGVEIKSPAHTEVTAGKKKLKGKIFVLTGSLKTMTRDEAKEKIRLLGGDVSDSISSKTDYLILGEEPGLKLEKAHKLGVKTIEEKEFLEMIK